MSKQRGLGTTLRALVYLIDQDLDATYKNMGLPFRSKYFPVLQCLSENNSCTVGEIVSFSGSSYPAISQVIKSMKADGLIHAEQGEDRRQQKLALTPKAVELTSKIKPVLHALTKVHSQLSDECGFDISSGFSRLLNALETHSFQDRIQAELQFEDPENH